MFGGVGGGERGRRCGGGVGGREYIHPIAC